MKILKVNEITKKFGGLIALSTINFSLEKGEILGLIGPNGSGKTTLFNIISGFYPPSNGYISFYGEKIVGLKPHSICKKGIARTFQIMKPMPGFTVLENVMVGALLKKNRMEEARKKALSVLKFTELEVKANTLAKNLTIGERKRLELTRALATEPKLILLDEVMGGLNPAETEEIVKLIRMINEEKAVAMIVIEHNMRAIMSISHRIIVLNYGEKIAEGKPENVAKNPAVIEAYLGEEYA